jgi:hypothetical protein
MKDIFVKIKKHLSDDLLHKNFSGHCYVASEAAYHLLGGISSDWKPMQMRHEGVSHWFLKNKKTGKVLDLTSEQFENAPNYSLAKGKGFLTKTPSKRAQKLIKKIQDI